MGKNEQQQARFLRGKKFMRWKMGEDWMVKSYRSIKCSHINPMDLTKGQPCKMQVQVHLPIAHCKAQGYETQMQEKRRILSHTDTLH
jgi:hypothetical protein